jgi:hypothetical protein
MIDTSIDIESMKEQFRGLWDVEGISMKFAVDYERVGSFYMGACAG